MIKHERQLYKVNKQEIKKITVYNNHKANDVKMHDNMGFENEPLQRNIIAKKLTDNMTPFGLKPLT